MLNVHFTEDGDGILGIGDCAKQIYMNGSVSGCTSPANIRLVVVQC
jgi:hypothetical protein